MSANWLKVVGRTIVNTAKVIVIGFQVVAIAASVIFVISVKCLDQKSKTAGKDRWNSVLEERREEAAAERGERESQRKSWDALEQPLPASGRVQTFHSGYRNAPFEIRSSAGANYLIKLVDAKTKQPVMTIFVRGGTPTEVDVPSGNFEIRYASGTKWYGDELLFGPDTSCSKANQSFSFSRGRGYTITLYKVHNGNLSTSPMSPADF